MTSHHSGTSHHSATSNLIFEARIEEIPAGAQQGAAQQFLHLVHRALTDEFGDLENLQPKLTLKADCGPRRLWLTAEGLPTLRPHRTLDYRGPREGAPEAAIAGFARSHRTTVEACELRQTPKGSFWFLTCQEGGGAAADLLPDLLLEALKGIKWPTAMTWAGPDVAFTRPIRGLLGVFAGAPLKGELRLNSNASLSFTAQTVGHRVHGSDGSGVPCMISVTAVDDYHNGLRAAGVLTSFAERRQVIQETLESLCLEAGYELELDTALLNEVTGLCEWPVAFLGKIESEFLDLPPEVLVTSMKVHQKFFAVRTQNGALAPVFAAVANLEAEDGGGAIRLGAQRVLRARLSDAVFFWDQDRKRGLSRMAEELSSVTFYAKLGSMAERVARIQTLAETFARFVGAKPETVRTAAALCKADLVSQTVGEFPELQGIIGMHLARSEGYEDDIAIALADHYAPAGPGGICPAAPVSVALCLAERVELLSGFFGIGEPPTGSRDPFALRRAALGLIRLILENNLTLTLEDVFASVAAPETRGALIAFILERLTIRLKAEGIEPELLRAVIHAKAATSGKGTDLCSLHQRITVLQEFLVTDSGVNLLAAYRRAHSILAPLVQDGAETASHITAGRFNPDALVQPEEKALAQHCDDVTQKIADSFEQDSAVRDQAALQALSQLRCPIDQFFDSVTVNDPEHRVNRLCLLARLTDLFDEFADFSAIPGDWSAPDENSERHLNQDH